jgi:hypothetical protein
MELSRPSFVCSADELSRRVNEVDHPEHAKLGMSSFKYPSALLRQTKLICGKSGNAMSKADFVQFLLATSLTDVRFCSAELSLRAKLADTYP